MRFCEIPKFMMLLFHSFTQVNKVSSVNLYNWLCGTSSFAQALCSENHSGHSIIRGIVFMKTAHRSNFGLRPLMSSGVLLPPPAMGVNHSITRLIMIIMNISATPCPMSLRRLQKALGLSQVYSYVVSINLTNNKYRKQAFDTFLFSFNTL